MFCELLKKLIADAIRTETAQAMKNYGETYASMHEAYAVLKEEVDEARDELVPIRNNLFDFWQDVKRGKINGAKVDEIRKHAELLALEAVQICAVCDKIKNSI